MKKIITIARQCGALGSTLGRAAAEALDLPYYDKDIILRTARESANLTPAEVRRWEEKVPHEFGFTQSLFDFYARPLGDRIWDAQTDAIRKLADAESCVIVGRNAEYILREFDHTLRVFLHADFDWRVAHMRQLMPDATDEQIRADIRAADKARAGYCTRYTGRRYGDAADFDLTLDVGKLTPEGALRLLLDAAALI